MDPSFSAKLESIHDPIERIVAQFVEVMRLLKIKLGIPEENEEPEYCRSETTMEVVEDKGLDLLPDEELGIEVPDEEIEVPIFSGADLGEWIEQMQMIMTRYEVPDIQWVNFSHVYVEGMAREWVKLNLIEISGMNWGQFVDAIQAQFEKKSESTVQEISEFIDNSKVGNVTENRMEVSPLTNLDFTAGSSQVMSPWKSLNEASVPEHNNVLVVDLSESDYHGTPLNIFSADAYDSYMDREDVPQKEMVVHLHCDSVHHLLISESYKYAFPFQVHEVFDQMLETVVALLIKEGLRNEVLQCCVPYCDTGWDIKRLGSDLLSSVTPKISEGRSPFNAIDLFRVDVMNFRVIEKMELLNLLMLQNLVLLWSTHSNLHSHSGWLLIQVMEAHLICVLNNNIMVIDIAHCRFELRYPTLSVNELGNGDGVIFAGLWREISYIQTMFAMGSINMLVSEPLLRKESFSLQGCRVVLNITLDNFMFSGFLCTTNRNGRTFTTFGTNMVSNYEASAFPWKKSYLFTVISLQFSKLHYEDGAFEKEKEDEAGSVASLKYVHRCRSLLNSYPTTCVQASDFTSDIFLNVYSILLLQSAELGIKKEAGWAMSIAIITNTRSIRKTSLLFATSEFLNQGQSIAHENDINWMSNWRDQRFLSITKFIKSVENSTAARETEMGSISMYLELCTLKQNRKCKHPASILLRVVVLFDFFNEMDLCKSVNLAEVVSYSVGVHVAILNGKDNEKVEDLVLLDVAATCTLHVSTEDTNNKGRLPMEEMKDLSILYVGGLKKINDAINNTISSFYSYQFVEADEWDDKMEFEEFFTPIIVMIYQADDVFNEYLAARQCLKAVLCAFISIVGGQQGVVDNVRRSLFSDHLIDIKEMTKSATNKVKMVDLHDQERVSQGLASQRVQPSLVVNNISWLFVARVELHHTLGAKFGVNAHNMAMKNHNCVEKWRNTGFDTQFGMVMIAHIFLKSVKLKGRIRGIKFSCFDDEISPLLQDAFLTVFELLHVYSNEHSENLLGNGRFIRWISTMGYPYTSSFDSCHSTSARARCLMIFELASLFHLDSAQSGMLISYKNYKYSMAPLASVGTSSCSQLTGRNQNWTGSNVGRRGPRES